MTRPAGVGAGHVRVAVLADTHLRSGSKRGLPLAVYPVLEQASLILHAGDVVDDGLLRQLASLAPTRAVLGNNDLSLAGTLPETVALDLAGVRVAMVHDSGARLGRAPRLRRRFPDADLVIFGHSHVPVDEEGVGGQRLFNPGSPTQRRSQPQPTMGCLEFADGRIVEHRVIAVG